MASILAAVSAHLPCILSPSHILSTRPSPTVALSLLIHQMPMSCFIRWTQTPQIAYAAFSISQGEPSHQEEV